MTGVNDNIDEMHNTTYFEVIEIVNGSKPYPMLLGLEWAFDN
jgi:hypothetical protein